MSDLDLLKIKLDEWAQLLGHDDVNSIGRQTAHMLWRSAFYRSINTSRQFLPENGEGNKKANRILHEFIDEGYLTIHAAGVRRLLDAYSISGARGVYSLPSLLEDIAAHAYALTRANVLEVRGLEYDFEMARARARKESHDEARRAGRSASFVDRGSWVAEQWHETMDKLCGVSKANRLPSDSPPRAKFTTLRQELMDAGAGVQKYMDKYIAHAATPESRKDTGADYHTLSLAKLW